MTNITEHRFEDRQLLQEALVIDTMDRLKQAVANRGAASMILSGGTSPGAFYTDLSKQSDLDWSKVTFSLSDERWVDADHMDSNARMVKQRLLQNHAEAASFIPLKTEFDSVMDGVEQSSQDFETLTRPLTVTLLGMGADGHAASLFPTASNIADMLDEANENLLSPVPMNGNDVDRISMTRHALMQSDVINLLFFGTEKWDVYQRAKSEKTLELPVSYLLHQDQVPVHIYWAV